MACSPYLLALILAMTENLSQKINTFPLTPVEDIEDVWKEENEKNCKRSPVLADIDQACYNDQGLVAQLVVKDVSSR